MRAFAGAKLRPAAPIRAQIYNPIFKIRYVRRSHLDVYFRSGRSLRRSASDAEELRAFAAGGCGPPIAARLIPCRQARSRAEAALTARELQFSARGGCGLLRPFGRKFMIQNSEFKIKRIFRTHLGKHPVSGRGLQRARMFGNELRASAAGRLRPARPF